MKKLERLLKYAEGGKVNKLQLGNKIFYRGAWLNSQEYLQILALERTNELAIAMSSDSEDGTLQSSQKYLKQTKITPHLSFEKDNNGNYKGTVTTTETEVNPEELFGPDANSESDNSENITSGIDTLGLDAFVKTGSAVVGSFGGLTGINGTIGFNLGYEFAKKAAANPEDKSAIAGAVVGTVGGAAVLAMGIAELALMSDKNFSAGSRTIDSVVHGASGALLKSGNPWAMGAGLALEGLNWITKAGGKNVLGYDVNINNSGYGNMGHLESEAGRIWDNWTGATARKLAKRNEQARMALAAMDISEDTAYEQEARQNSVTNVLQLNQIALSGGIDTSLLGS